MQISLIEPLGVDKTVINKLAEGFLAAGHKFTAYDSVEKNTNKLITRCKDADVLIIANNPLPAEVIENAENLKFISVAFVGTDHIAEDACRARNIAVSNAAAYCDDAVAELAIGLTLDCLRNVTACDRVVREGGTKHGLVGFELSGKTVGIIGTGGIGCRTAELFGAFGCKLLGYSRSESQRAKHAGVEYVSLETLLQTSDIVSLHMPLTADTRKFIDTERIGLMKKSAILINTARGAIVDNDALAEALNSGMIAAAGIDVFDMEPPVPGDYLLLKAKNTVLTPHIAFATKESIERRAQITFDNIYKWLDNSMQNRVI